MTDLVRHNDRIIYNLTFQVRQPDGSVREAKFETTDDHPWRLKGGEWLTTIQLTPGLQVQAAYGESVTVKSVVNTGRVQPTYNITVADFHTYFVGEDRIWVHNANCNIGESKKQKKARCIAECTATLPTNDYGASFFKCMRMCMEEY